MDISRFFLAVVYLTLLHTVFGNSKEAAESTYENGDNTAAVSSTYQYRRIITAASTPYRKRRTTAAFVATTAASSDTTAASSDTTTAASTPYQDRRTTAAGSFENGNEHGSIPFTIVPEEGKRYLAKKGYWNWTESKTECQNIGMDLATIATATELNLLHKNYNKEKFSNGLWIATSDSKHPPASSWDETVTNDKNLPVVTWNIFEGYTVCRQFDPRLPSLSLKRCERRANVLCETNLVG